jgi:hypothetical protein
MSRGGAYAYAWATANPTKVSCIYADVCRSLDPLLDDQTLVAEKRYNDLGGKIVVIVKEGEGHYPLTPKDPKPVVDFVTENTH